MSLSSILLNGCHTILSSSSSSLCILLPITLKSNQLPTPLGLRGIIPKLLTNGIGVATTAAGFMAGYNNNNAIKQGHERWRWLLTPSSGLCSWRLLVHNNVSYCESPPYGNGITTGLPIKSMQKGEDYGIEGKAAPCVVKQVKYSSLKEEHNKKVSFIQGMLRSVWRLIQLMFRFGPCLMASPLLLFGNTWYKNWWWEWLIYSIESSGPAFIKLGQWAGTRRDLFPQYVIQYLSQLHTQVRPHSYKDTLLQLDESYGPEWRTWLEIDKEVVGSGCIAQVHKGRLLNNTGNAGNVVAVKVSHPGCQDIIDIDLGILKALGHVVDHIPYLKHLGVSDMVEQFSDFLLSQTDLRQEASNIQRFRANFQGHPDIAFPRVYNDITTRTVLIETFEPGVPIGAILNRNNNNNLDNDDDKVYILDGGVMVSKRDVCQKGVKAFLHMLFIDNFIHGDLHPGNILIQPNKEGGGGGIKLIFLDCGLANELSDRDLTNFVDLMHAIMIGESDEVGRLMIERSRSPPHTVYKADEFINGVKELVDSARGVTLQGMQLGIIFSQLLGLACKHCVRLEANFVSVVCATMVLEGLGRSLDPQLDILKEARPFVAKALFNRVVYNNNKAAAVQHHHYHC